MDAAEKIAARVRRGRERYDADEDVQIVLTHLVQVIGEASFRLSSELTGRYRQVPWRQIVGMRHRVVHDYFAVDLDVLWAAASIDVPRLAEQVQGILDELTSHRDGIAGSHAAEDPER
nr:MULTISPECIES: HepT-like ribonuclease domain-containing protein [Protofrankia]